MRPAELCGQLGGSARRAVLVAVPPMSFPSAQLQVTPWLRPLLAPGASKKVTGEKHEDTLLVTEKGQENMENKHLFRKH